MVGATFTQRYPSPMEAYEMTESISMKDFHADESAKDWRIVGDGACAFFPTASFAASAKLIETIAGL
ncbi:MAG: hypothetical protein WBO97_12945, partial [Tepidiformaceae bacterium]